MTDKIDICREKTEKVLLVEGKTDCHVVMSLCKAFNVTEGLFGIYQCGSDDGVLKRLDALIALYGDPKVIGVMLDNDKPGRWQSIENIVKKYSYQFPKKPDVNGTCIQGIDDEPKLGFWLMPNNQDSGMLEDFCVELAEPESLTFARECVEQAQQKKLTTFKQVHQSKAIVHTYLAWQDEPGYPLGKAITSQALLSNRSIATSFTDWLIRLFTSV
jgi:5S rRNA maturation endonuclease (ribonuclease M5)